MLCPNCGNRWFVRGKHVIERDAFALVGDSPDTCPACGHEGEVRYGKIIGHEHIWQPSSMPAALGPGKIPVICAVCGVFKWERADRWKPGEKLEAK
jgi:hypothetical protein